RNNLTEKQRHRLVEHLLKGSQKGKVARGDLKKAAADFSCSYEQVTGVWKRYKQQIQNGEDVNLRNGRFGHSGRRGVDVEKVKEALKTIPMKNRTTMRALASELGMTRTTLNRNLPKLGLRAASRFLKPYLTDAGKERRLERAKRWPPNSPDTNILDLFFFNSIQSLQDRTTLRTVDELIEEVRRVFAAQESAALGRVWTTYQAVLQEIMLAKGDNTFKLPH
ncbi:unnamed protein product, partial [Ascophyllum nodosum]